MSFISKISWISLTSILISFSLPTKAQLPIPQSLSFEDFLTSVLTPLEAQAYQTMGTEKATELAKQACRALSSGQTVTEYATEVAQDIASGAVSPEQLQGVAGLSGKVIAAAVTTMCPEHMTQLQQLEIPVAQ